MSTKIAVDESFETYHDVMLMMGKTEEWLLDGADVSQPSIPITGDKVTFSIQSKTIFELKKIIQVLV